MLALKAPRYQATLKIPQQASNSRCKFPSPHSIVSSSQITPIPRSRFELRRGRGPTVLERISGCFPDGARHQVVLNFKACCERGIFLRLILAEAAAQWLDLLGATFKLRHHSSISAANEWSCTLVMPCGHASLLRTGENPVIAGG